MKRKREDDPADTQEEALPKKQKTNLEFRYLCDEGQECQTMRCFHATERAQVLVDAKYPNAYQRWGCLSIEQEHQTRLENQFLEALSFWYPKGVARIILSFFPHGIPFAYILMWMGDEIFNEKSWWLASGWNDLRQQTRELEYQNDDEQADEKQADEKAPVHLTVEPDIGLSTAQKFQLLEAVPWALPPTDLYRMFGAYGKDEELYKEYDTIFRVMELHFVD